MKTNNKILVYDDACPMCAWYTGAFVQSGLLAEEGRKAFSTCNPELLHRINQQRGKNEIPLIDRDTRQVWYGIDALLEILGQRFPVIKTIGQWPPIYWGLKKLYNFISYNRKVIVARKSVPGTVDCTPDFNMRYRVLFMAVFLTVNTLMLFPLHRHPLVSIPFYHLSVYRLQALHTALVCCNCLLACCMNYRKAIDYLGQVNMLALVTILLLVPLVITNTKLHNIGWFNLTYILLLTAFVMKEYFRRMDYVNIAERYKWVIPANLFSLAAFIACLFIL